MNIERACIEWLQSDQKEFIFRPSLTASKAKLSKLLIITARILLMPSTATVVLSRARFDLLFKCK